MGAADTPQMERGLKSRHVEMIAIGGIIGAGLFVGSSTSIATVGPAVIVSYLLAGLVILLVMRMLSEMAVANPGISSFTEFARLGLGNGAGFVTGWLYWYFWVVVVGIEAIAGAKILSAWLPFEVWEIGLGLMLVMTAVNLMSARSYGEFEFWFSSLKVAAILVFIAIAGAYVLGLTGRPDPDTNHLVAHGVLRRTAGLPLSGVVSVIFALTGAEIATIAAAESAEPTRTIARLTWSVCARILLFYVVSISLIVAAVPWTSIVPGESPFAAVLDAIHIPYAGTIMNIVVLIAVLSCLNSGLYVTSRVLFALAVRGDARRRW
nr:amino acid permease [Hankyongella ginsenosidimutans]